MGGLEGGRVEREKVGYTRAEKFWSHRGIEQLKWLAFFLSPSFPSSLPPSCPFSLSSFLLPSPLPSCPPSLAPPLPHLCSTVGGAGRAECLHLVQKDEGQGSRLAEGRERQESISDGKQGGKKRMEGRGERGGRS